MLVITDHPLPPDDSLSRCPSLVQQCSVETAFGSPGLCSSRASASAGFMQPSPHRWSSLEAVPCPRPIAVLPPVFPLPGRPNTVASPHQPVPTAHSHRPFPPPHARRPEHPAPLAGRARRRASPPSGDRRWSGRLPPLSGGSRRRVRTGLLGQPHRRPAGRSLHRSHRPGSRPPRQPGRPPRRPFQPRPPARQPICRHAPPRPQLGPPHDRHRIGHAGLRQPRLSAVAPSRC